MSQPVPALRSDAQRNQHRVLEAAREVFGESGADASMEEIAARAGVGVGTVYRRFSGKDALIDELLRLAVEEILEATDLALARTDGRGLEGLLRAIGLSFAAHRQYANLLLERRIDAHDQRIREAIVELTQRAAASGVIRPDVSVGDVMALVWGMRGVVQAVGEASPQSWERFLEIHLTGMTGGRAGPPTRKSSAADRH